MNRQAQPDSDASIGELLSSMTNQTARLVRDEIRLAQREFQDSACEAGVGAGLISIAGMLLVLSSLTLVGSAVAALALALPVWAAALIVGVALLTVTGVTAAVSRREIASAARPAPQTVASVKKDIGEVKAGAHVHE